MVLLLRVASQAFPQENHDLEKRVMALAEELRCLVCQNQTLADSHAALAIDLKNRIRELLRDGKSEREVLDFMVERYGDFVLYRPPLRATTVPLWAGPCPRRDGTDGVAAKEEDAGNRVNLMNRKRILIVGAALAFPLVVAGIYVAVGTPAALSPQKAPAKD